MCGNLQTQTFPHDTLQNFREINFLPKAQCHTVLVITTKSPENKDFEISESLLKIVFYFTCTL